MTSTPAASPNRPSDNQDEANDSMPSLASATDQVADSGNSSGDDLVKLNFESDLLKLYLQVIHDFNCRHHLCRDPLLRTKKARTGTSTYDDSQRLEKIMITRFITYLLHLFIIYYLYSRTSESIVFLSFTIDTNME